MNLGENIYKFRAQKNMSQGDLADALDVSRQSVSKWENNNAVPDLERLVKMSELFGITLDELIGKEPFSPADRDSIPAQVQQIIIQSRAVFPAKKLIGILLLAMGVLFLPFSLSATKLAVMLGCLLFAALFSLCGIFTLKLHYPYVCCGWTVLAVYTLYVFLLTGRWETEYFHLLMIGLGLSAMIWWTVTSHRKQRIHVPTWLWWVGGLMLAGFLILFCMNFLQPIGITTVEHAATPSVN